MDGLSIPYLVNLQSLEEFEAPRAGAFADAVARSPFTGLIGKYHGPLGQEVVAFVADIEVPQFPVADIREREPIAVAFDPADIRMPEVLMLREDFPKLPHRLLRSEERPVSLCLFDIPFSEIKTFWTGPRYLSRIREWLKLTAVGQLHPADQPLEPLLFEDGGTIIYDFLSGDGNVFFYSIGNNPQRILLYATQRRLENLSQAFAAELVRGVGTPQVHGVIERTPTNSETLHQLLLPVNINIKTIVRDAVAASYGNNEKLARRLVIWVTLPKLRNADSAMAEETDQFVFVFSENIRSMGLKLGLWEGAGETQDIGWIMGAEVRDTAHAELSLVMIRPISFFNYEKARKYNGVSTIAPLTRFMAVGAGALGSQILANIARTGLGTHKILDKDLFMPHNMARHALTWSAQLSWKAESMAQYLNEILPGIAEAIVANVLESPPSESLVTALENSDVYLDFSASTSVLRAVGALGIQRRTISCFMSPTGRDVVVLSQDAAMQVSVSNLEIQYLRFIFKTSDLHDHLISPGNRIRFGGGCNDVSAIIPQDSVAFAAALGAKAIRKTLESADGFIKVWRLDPETLDPRSFSTPIYPTQSITEEGWEVRVDDFILRQLRNLRLDCLPNETGGILVGTYDMERRIIYVGDVIPSPPDSHEYPTAYIRGVSGVRDQLDEYGRVLGGAFTYIGEWHSHPNGASTSMSAADIILFRWLQAHMSDEGLPALMGIVGEKNTSFFVK